jgi:hypothetical protein
VTAKRCSTPDPPPPTPTRPEPANKVGQRRAGRAELSSKFPGAAALTCWQAC